MDINFNPGGLKDVADNRDYQFKNIGGAAPFDWIKGFDIENFVPKMPVKNQGQSGSCGGQAWAYYMAVLDYVNNHTFEERSAKFIYSQTFVPGGGSRGRDNCDIVIKQGVSQEALLTSYENGQPPSEAFMERPQDITDDARKDARATEALSYYNVDADIDSIATAMEHGNGLILGIGGENNGTWLTAYPKPPVNPTWGHWVYAGKAKLINGQKYIGILNSWGDAVGERGWQWIGEDYFKSGNVWNGWVLIYNNDVFSHNFQVDMEYGQENDEIKALQQALQIEYCFPITQKPTGFYGDITKRAVLRFMQKYSIGTWYERSVYPAGKRVGKKIRAQLNLLFSK